MEGIVSPPRIDNNVKQQTTIIMKDKYDTASYGAFGVNYIALTPQQQQIIIEFLNPTT